MGPDNIPAYLLKEVALQIAPSLAMIFRLHWKVVQVVTAF